MLAGMVSTYFQFASHFKCMKNRITKEALAHDTIIMPTIATIGADSLMGELPMRKEIDVKTHNPTKTDRYRPKLP